MISCRQSEWTKIARRKYYLLPKYCWVAKFNVENLILFLTIFIWNFDLVHSCTFILFVQLFVLWGHVFCLLSGYGRLSVSWWLKMYCFYSKVSLYSYLSFGGHIFCPLSGDRRLSVSLRLEKCIVSVAKSIGGHIVYPLYRGNPYLGQSIVGGSTVPYARSYLEW